MNETTTAPRQAWPVSPAVQQWRELYPQGKYSDIPPATAHRPYIYAVAATLAASGFNVSSCDAEWCDMDREPRSAFITLPIYGDGEPDGALNLRWSECTGWEFATDEDPMADYGLEPGGMDLLADPIAVTHAVDGIFAGYEGDTTPVAPREVSTPDVTLEAALGAYRTHPGYLAMAAVADDRPADLSDVPRAGLPQPGE